MTTWIAFLRALNVGGRRLTNDMLAGAFADAGMEDVRTFLASGNVVFQASTTDEAQLVSRLEDGLRAALGYEVPAYLRSSEQVRELAALEPFEGLERSPDGKPQVMFANDHLDDDQARAVAAIPPDAELLVPLGREIHWLPRSGMSTSELDLRALEAIVGPFTIRTHNTVRRLTSKFLHGSPTTPPGRS